MPSESDAVPAGWYPAPNGGRRYWDGQRWLALPDPDQQHTAAPAAVAASSTEEAGRGPKKPVLIASVVAAVILVVAGVGFFIWKSNHDTEMQNAAVAASSSKAAADAADAARRDIEAKRAERAAFVKEIEGTIKTLAEKQSSEGAFEGPVLSASCSPVNGGSTDDLTAKTTVFECFVANKNNDDGSQSGVKYHATANWDAKDYTYGFGAPR